jgi:hypothetical protein
MHCVRIPILALLCILVLGLTIPVRGQQQQSPTVGRGILGYLDPRTGAFHPAIPQALTDSTQISAATAAPTTGKFVFDFTITVDSALASSVGIECGAQAETVDETSERDIVEEAAVAATRSGSTAKCTVTIPYSWPLESASSDSVTLEYFISAPTAAPSLPSRTSTQTIGVIKVPATGATTTETITAVF